MPTGLEKSVSKEVEIGPRQGSSAEVENVTTGISSVNTPRTPFPTQVRILMQRRHRMEQEIGLVLSTSLERLSRVSTESLFAGVPSNIQLDKLVNPLQDTV
jgi:hypothetical protein